MAHYAFLDNNNVVVEVIVGVDENKLIEGLEPEIWYQKFKGMTCKRTSFDGKIRGKYAGIGDIYDEKEDVFVAKQPFSSWIRKKSFWEPPISQPSDGKSYVWNENLLDWIEIGN